MISGGPAVICSPSGRPDIVNRYAPLTVRNAMTRKRDVPQVTNEWAHFIHRTSFEDLDGHVVKQTKRLILDHIGNTVAGFSTEYGKIMAHAVESLAGKRESLIFGLGKRTSCPFAAFANVRMSNAVDIDEILYNQCHVGPIPIGSALAAAEKVSASGKDVILATALGYDFGARFCLATPSGIPKDTTKGEVGAISGYGYNTIAAAISAAKIFRLDQKKIAMAMGAAAWYSPISLAGKWMNEIPLTKMKYSDLGWITQAGIIAVLLVQSGLSSSLTILDDDFFPAALGIPKYNLGFMNKDLGRKWYILSAGIKLYPV